MKKNGYTLIELLVALAVFTVVIAAPTGFFVSSLKAQQKALASQELYDNVSYVLEYMSRALRMAKKDSTGSCLGVENMNYAISTHGDGIIFNNYEGKCQEFYLDASNKRLKEIRDGVTSFLTVSNIEVVAFYIDGEDTWSQEDDYQPEVTLLLEIKGKRGELPELKPTMKIQTSISQRDLDIKY